MGYIFAIHVPIAGLSLIPVFFAGLPLILWPVHIVFLELIIDPACSIIFEAEKGEKNVMSRPPKDIDEPFFGAKKVLLGCTQGAGILVICLMVYFVGLETAMTEKAIRTLTFVTLLTSNIAFILSNRSWSSNILEILATPNKTVKWVVGGAILSMLLILKIPFLLELFQFEMVGYIELLLCMVAGFMSIAWFEFYKYRKKLKKSKI